MAPKETASDFYELLGVPKDATPADIKAAHRRLVKVAHSDTGGTDGLFRLVTVAYETLSDPEKRAEYDREMANSSSDANGASNESSYSNESFTNTYGHAMHDDAYRQFVDERFWHRMYAAEAARHIAAEQFATYAPPPSEIARPLRPGWQQPAIAAAIVAAWWIIRDYGIGKYLSAKIDDQRFDPGPIVSNTRTFGLIAALVLAVLVVRKVQNLYKPTLIGRLPQRLRPWVRALVAGLLVTEGLTMNTQLILFALTAAVTVAVPKLYAQVGDRASDDEAARTKAS